MAVDGAFILFLSLSTLHSQQFDFPAHPRQYATSSRISTQDRKHYANTAANMPGLTLPDSPTDTLPSPPTGSPIHPAPSPSITLGRLGFLAAHPRYLLEKPVIVVPPAKPLLLAANVIMDYRDVVPVEDVRPWMRELKLDEHGFQVMRHRSGFEVLDSKEVCEGYKSENQEALKRELGAETVVTWGLRVRLRWAWS